MHDAKWLKDVLAANGLTTEALKKAGLTDMQIQNLLADKADKNTWNAALTYLNAIPPLDYPAADILTDLEDIIQEEGADAPLHVYYGVSAGNLIFAGFLNPADMRSYGAPVQTDWINVLELSAQEAQELFEKQNLTLQ
jgi:hypothetical protein